MADGSPTGGRPASPVAVMLLGIFVTAQIVLAAYCIFQIWPDTMLVVTSSSDTVAPAETVAVRLFGVTIPTTVDGLYVVLVVAAGILGSALHAAHSLGFYVGNRSFKASWTFGYLLRLPIGLGLPLIIYFAIKGGLININAGSEALNPYGIVAIAGLAGMFSHQIVDWLIEWAEKRFPATRTETLFAATFGQEEDVQPTSTVNRPVEHPEESRQAEQPPSPP